MIVAVGIAAHGLLLLTDYVIWDGWWIQAFLQNPSDWSNFQRIFSEAGRNLDVVWYLPLLGQSACVVISKFVSVLCWLLSGVLVYQLMLAMAVFVLAPIARMTRGSMLQVLSADFVRTARASGLSAPTVLVRYALRNALLPVVTTLGMVFGFMLGSSVVVEKVFGWPGVGSYAIDALTASDYAPVQGFVLAMGVLFVLLNLLVDVLYTLIDPRVSLEN